MKAHVLIAALAVMGVTASAAQLPTFSARAELVQVDVLVTDGGRIVPGLQAQDFELRDEGVLQRVELANIEDWPLNVVLAFDLSDSVNGAPLEQLRRGGHALLGALHRDDRAALLTFDNRATLRAAPTSDARALQTALDEMRVQTLGGVSGTTVFDATYAAMVVGNAENRRPLVIAFTDGIDTGSWLTADRVLDAARWLNVVAYGVIPRRPGSPFLRDLTKVTGGQLLEAGSSDETRAAFVRILDEFRNRYVLHYSPQGVRNDGWHRLDVRVKGRRATVTARSGYMAGR